MASGPPGVLLLATSNDGKRRELQTLLPAGVSLLLLTDLGLRLPPEVGTSFASIAELKALSAADRSGLLALADDSGLEVAALKGAPGVRTARFAGEGATDGANRAALLAALRDVPADERFARFQCAIAVARPGEVLGTTHGTCDGRIGFTERGTNGFGYDPIFELADGRTMAELTPEEKDRISHRGRAVRAMLPLLLPLLGLDRERNAAS